MLPKLPELPKLLMDPQLPWRPRPHPPKPCPIIFEAPYPKAAPPSKPAKIIL